MNVAIRPAESRDGVGDLHDEVEVAGQRAHVVAGLFERVLRVGQLERPVLAPAQEEVLELGAELEFEAEVGRALERRAKDRPRAVGPGLALDGGVAGEARDVAPPRQDRERSHVGHGDQVGGVRALTDVTGCEAGEARPLLQQIVEVGRRDELGVRLRVHVHELREQELDPRLLDYPPYVVGILGRGAHSTYVYPPRPSRGNGSKLPLAPVSMYTPHICPHPPSFTGSARRTAPFTA
jgi:hypothetical protein